MLTVSEPILVLQYLVTASSSAFNATYFMRHRSQVWRRRVGALALALISLAVTGGRLYLALLTLSWNNSGVGLPFSPGYWLVVGLLACLGSLLITSLIIRQLRGDSNGHQS